ncbi:hypothetical protein [Cupriavidus sp. CP313]
MNKNSWLAIAAAAGCIAGCGSVPVEQKDSRGIVTITLVALSGNLGRVGQATLIPQGDRTRISIFVSNVPDDVALPPALHSYIYPGSCTSLAAKPAFEMNRTVLLAPSADVPWTLRKSLPVSLPALLENNHAVVVRTGPEDGFRNIFCGAIRRA